ncbi:MAG: hypothetical protein CEN92_50 [Candidatus Berkelbacteria bacterium Licking1014_96]|uniref:Uncharacterized protein n=1 Tax=Candidatus Berkelbacteria bacterium Licking1014_96 TaxID=2017149 RepID=A0A554LHA2_9BACT|nr:MAG: hypothetical protein CEN92_50 [Candidatus Berkelbacteria bacterium Licking1014_96]
MAIVGTILRKIYPPGEIFIQSAKFDDDEMSVEVTCLVPSGSNYTLRPINYVTVENYVRCLSQASYLLAYRLLERGLVSIDVSPEEFAQAAVNHELYYRKLPEITYHKKVSKDVLFVIRLTLKNIRKIKRIGDFVLFSFTIERTVISGDGEMKFVYDRGAEA